MSAFNERGGDWQRFMDHHHGRRDAFVPPDQSDNQPAK
jgi:hypothetical protein